MTRVNLQPVASTTLAPPCLLPHAGGSLFCDPIWGFWGRSRIGLLRPGAGVFRGRAPGGRAFLSSGAPRPSAEPRVPTAPALSRLSGRQGVWGSWRGPGSFSAPAVPRPGRALRNPVPGTFRDSQRRDREVDSSSAIAVSGTTGVFCGARAARNAVDSRAQAHVAPGLGPSRRPAGAFYCLLSCFPHLCTVPPPRFSFLPLPT